jgi:hypothetical protein
MTVTFEPDIFNNSYTGYSKALQITKPLLKLITMSQKPITIYIIIIINTKTENAKSLKDARKVVETCCRTLFCSSVINIASMDSKTKSLVLHTYNTQN